MRKTAGKRNLAFMAIVIAIIMSFSCLALTACGGGKEDVGTITLSATTLTLTEGQMETLTATTSNAGATVSWSTSDKAIATVSRGRVTGVKAGTATIKASINDDVYAECAVTVVADERTITLDQTTATVDVATSNKLTLKATVSDSSNVEWSSSDSNLATVVDGVVTFKKTANKTATVTITAKIANSNKTATCVITVNNSAIPDDYKLLNKNTSKINLINNPDDWQYFLKNAHTSRVEFAEDEIAGQKGPYYANGKLNIALSKVSTDTVGTAVVDSEGNPVLDEDGNPVMKYDNTELYLRYQPGAKVGLAQGDIYTVTFKVKANAAGEFGFTKGSGKVEGLGSAIGTEDEDDPETKLEVEANKEYTVTLTNCLVDDDGLNADGQKVGDPLSIWPRIYTMPTDGSNLLIQAWDFNFEKTGHSDAIGGNAPTSDSYSLPKAANNNGSHASAAFRFPGKWSYYLSNAGASAGCVLKEGKYDGETKSVIATYTEFSQNNVRLYYMPGEAEGKEVTVSFKIAMNVDGTISFGDGGSHDTLTLKAGEAQEVTITFTVSNKALLLNPSLANADDKSEVTFTITDFSCVAK